MKCVCDQPCQVRDKSTKRAVTYFRGDVAEFDECPKYFRCIERIDPEGPPPMIDFALASEQELIEGDYDLDELKEFITRVYGKKAGNRGKETTVALLLDCRFRDSDNINLESIS